MANTSATLEKMRDKEQEILISINDHEIFLKQKKAEYVTSYNAKVRYEQQIKPAKDRGDVNTYNQAVNDPNYVRTVQQTSELAGVINALNDAISKLKGDLQKIRIMIKDETVSVGADKTVKQMFGNMRKGQKPTFAPAMFTQGQRIPDGSREPTQQELQVGKDKKMRWAGRGNVVNGDTSAKILDRAVVFETPEYAKDLKTDNQPSMTARAEVVEPVSVINKAIKDIGNAISGK